MDEQLPDDGLKWFGEGFDGFPKRLPDDCVEYIIHILNHESNGTSATRSRLSEIVRAANELKNTLLKDYIWQRDGFEFSVHPKLGQGDRSADKPESLSAPHLRGRTNFGDSVADEWLVVYLLREIGRQFSDAWIRVYDTDGEFLLIEAANSLPNWLNPDIAENRVWLNDGRLKIISLDEDAASRNLQLSEALSIIKRAPGKLLVQPAIEKEAFYRLREYPSAISSSLHHALLTIPRRLAYILNRRPTYISSAIESFYLRDPISLKPLATKDLSTLNFPPEDFVSVTIKFTKVGYAQLRSQLFDPPPAWTGVIPHMKDEKVALGMKLTCGFEIFVADPNNQDNRNAREIQLLLEDIENGDETLPSDADIAAWPRIRDDEKWLDIDYNEFEKELSGKENVSDLGGNGGFGDQGAQENLRKMVSRFQDFLDDDDHDADAEGIGSRGDDGDDESTASSDEDIEKESDEQLATEDAEFERAMKETSSMQEADIEENGLLNEARKLALQDDEDGEELDEDEEMRKVMELMEKELKGHGALNLNENAKDKGKGKATAGSASKSTIPQNPFFGPPRPPHMQNSVASGNVRFDEEADEEVGPGDGELSSDDEEFNDVDLGLAKNMLEAFKGQAGMPGPAGNMMKALGINMPRDEDHEGG